MVALPSDKWPGQLSPASWFCRQPGSRVLGLTRHSRAPPCPGTPDWTPGQSQAIQQGWAQCPPTRHRGRSPAAWPVSARLLPGSSWEAGEGGEVSGPAAGHVGHTRVQRRHTQLAAPGQRLSVGGTGRAGQPCVPLPCAQRLPCDFPSRRRQLPRLQVHRSAAHGGLQVR